MQINIHGRSIVRVLAVGAATVGVGAATFFGGQSTRMDNTAVAAVKHQAVDNAVKEVETAHAKQLAIFRADAAKDKREAVRHAKRETRRNERNRAEKLSDHAREHGYSSGNAAGYTNGETAGHESGVKDGIDEASDELDCSDDSDVSLPACTSAYPEYDEDDSGDPGYDEDDYDYDE